MGPYILRSRLKFQPTLPLRGATQLVGVVQVREVVSTHAPLAGSDFIRCLTKGQIMFQPTLPLRGATVEGQGFGSEAVFQPTLPLRGAT